MQTQPHHWQFRLVDLLVAAAVLAVLMGLETGTHGGIRRLLAPTEWQGYLALALFVATFFLARVGADVNLVCGMLAISWHFALIGILHRMISGMTIINGTSLPLWMLMRIYRAVLAEIVAPIVLSAPTVGWLLVRCRGSLNAPTKAALVTAMIAVADVAMIAVVSVGVFAYRVVEGGVGDWSQGP